MAKDKKRIVLDLEKRPEIREVLAELHLKTGMRNAKDIIILALKQMNANLPAAPKGSVH